MALQKCESKWFVSDVVKSFELILKEIVVFMKELVMRSSKRGGSSLDTLVWIDSTAL